MRARPARVARAAAPTHAAARPPGVSRGRHVRPQPTRCPPVPRRCPAARARARARSAGGVRRPRARPRARRPPPRPRGRASGAPRPARPRGGPAPGIRARARARAARLGSRLRYGLASGWPAPLVLRGRTCSRRTRSRSSASPAARRAARGQRAGARERRAWAAPLSVGAGNRKATRGRATLVVRHRREGRGVCN